MLKVEPLALVPPEKTVTPVAACVMTALGQLSLLETTAIPFTTAEHIFMSFAWVTFPGQTIVGF